MRDIKFRAWQDGEMLTQPMGGNYALRRFFGFIYEDAPIMQFTGLKDKNGKEIYSGDIFEITDGDEWTVDKHVAKMDCETLCIDDRCIGEIIGNIYESPERVKE